MLTVAVSCFKDLKRHLRVNGGVPAALGVYRLISWFLTSLFYFLGPPLASRPFKPGVVLSLFLEGAIAYRLYLEARRNHPAAIKALVSLETLGVAGLLLPTGGLDSPFIWYAVNPIVTAAAELAFPWCWGILGGFLAAVVVLPRLWPPPPEAAGSFDLAPHSHLLLVLALLTLGTQLLARLVRQAERQAALLEEQRSDLERSLGLITSLYRLVEFVSARNNVQEVLGLLAEYARKLSGAAEVIVWLDPAALSQKEKGWTVAGPEALYSPEEWARDREHLWPELKQAKEPAERTVTLAGNREGRAVYFPIWSPVRAHGILVALYLNPAAVGGVSYHMLKFLSDFIAVALERCYVEELNNQLLVAEEQNRIAGEIHDGVAQYLFTIACGCHALQEKWLTLSPEIVRQRLDLLARTAHQAAQELRISIYRLSPRRQGKEVFSEGVNAYLEELAALNGVRINFQVEGSEEVLSPALRTAFYRIIREACGNAIRHGRCRSLSVSLMLDPVRSELKVEDDGCGFRPELVKGKGPVAGLGLLNMRHLAASFGGELNIESMPGRGTRLHCMVPKKSDGQQTRQGGLNGEACGNR